MRAWVAASGAKPVMTGLAFNRLSAARPTIGRYATSRQPETYVSERAMGFEPTTSSLGSWHSTTELRPRAESGTFGVVLPDATIPLTLRMLSRVGAIFKQAAEFGGPGTRVRIGCPGRRPNVNGLSPVVL